MKIREGYKKSDVGVIPNEWDVKTIGELGIFSKGRGIKKDESQSGNIPCIRYGELYTVHNDYIKKCTSFISKEVAETSKRLKNGDILFAGSGETKEDIGKCATFVDHYEAYVGGDVIVLSPKGVDSLFLGYLLNTPNINKQKASKAQGDAVVHISAKNLSDIQIFIPQLPEQKAIALSLKDIDSLIISLEKVIDKKKKIKKGTMQQLLTGKKRLPGFTGEWEVKKLGNIASIIKGQLITENDAEQGIIPVIAGGKKPSYYHSCANRQGKTITVSASGANAGYVNFHIDPIFASDCSTISESDKYCIEFIYYQLVLLQEQIYYAQTGGAQPHIHPKDLNPLLINFTDMKEQSAIARIIVEMEAEIVALKQKLDKYKTIKQGMMQELLTGRIRLI